MANSIIPNPLSAKLFTPFNASEAKSPELRSGLNSFNNTNNPPNTAPMGGLSSSPTTRMSSMSNISQIEQSYQYSETMSLQLKTKEGDTVTVDFRQLYAHYQSLSQSQERSQWTDADASATQPVGARYFASTQALEASAFEERFGFSVNGELNEDELNAVFEVFAQVDQLANTFFNGDIESALQQAQDMNINFGQLQSVQFNLTQTQSVTSRYQQAALAQYSDVQHAADAENAQAAQNSASLSDLPPYLQQWQVAIERLDEQFLNAKNSIDTLMGNTLTQRFGGQEGESGWFERVQSFHKTLVEWAQAKAEPLSQAEEGNALSAPNPDNQNDQPNQDKPNQA
ncbi:hypothetical protein [Thiomicrorhabdus aquaedulcis]|uniref:hypothetical protein n=1 Tax=Thiomicrorhabdus aquaedulcis TaxID=2211106 RepID=UPI000FD9AB3B|nr:hypothetical protein [Thiomicrorhabdus aquaedulcis]